MTPSNFFQGKTLSSEEGQLFLFLVFQRFIFHADYIDCLVSVQSTFFIIAQHPLFYR